MALALTFIAQQVTSFDLLAAGACKEERNKSESKVEWDGIERKRRKREERGKRVERVEKEKRVV